MLPLSDGGWRAEWNRSTLEYQSTQHHPSTAASSKRKRQNRRERRKNPAIHYPSTLSYDGALFLGPDSNPFLWMMMMIGIKEQFFIFGTYQPLPTSTYL